MALIGKTLSTNIHRESKSRCPVWKKGCCWGGAGYLGRLLMPPSEISVALEHLVESGYLALGIVLCDP